MESHLPACKSTAGGAPGGEKAAAARAGDEKGDHKTESVWTTARSAHGLAWNVDRNRNVERNVGIG